MDQYPVEWTDVEVKTSETFWAGWFAITSLSTVGLILTGHPVGFVLGLILAFQAAYSIARLTSSETALRITEEGLVDRSHWTSAGLIRWSEITDVRASKWGMIEIDLRNEQAFWERLTPLQKLGRAKLQLYGYSPATLIPWLLDGSRAEIVEELQSGLDLYTLRSGAQSPELPTPNFHRPDAII